MNRLVNIGPFEQEIAKTTTVEELRSVLYEFVKSIQKEIDHIESSVLPQGDVGGVSGTFVSADVPPKTITVTNGIVMTIS